MCASSKPAWTIFFECDIADRRSTRSSGTGAMATARLEDSRVGKAREGTEQPVRAGVGEADQSEVLHGAQGNPAPGVRPRPVVAGNVACS